MARRFLSHLLGVWLLLSQLPRGLPAQEMDENLKLCGRRLVREWIAVCGMVRSTALSEEEPQIPSRSPTEIVPSPINEDAETLNMMSESIPNLPQELKATLSEMQPSLKELRLSVPGSESLQLAFEEYKKMVQAQSEAEKNRLLKLHDVGLSNHSRKKRLLPLSLSEACCQIGCTRRALARACSF
ncbi:prorelaxin-like [Choloepus didactylus]|uniref:prorelaxin-like n=1 Tax=Choloepus didactylus TaxID=27675 RepID=UPI0018A0246B|nr:prorelaxin-like [Choloepus didactylus]